MKKQKHGTAESQSRGTVKRSVSKETEQKNDGEPPDEGVFCRGRRHAVSDHVASDALSDKRLIGYVDRLVGKQFQRQQQLACANFILCPRQFCVERQ